MNQEDIARERRAIVFAVAELLRLVFIAETIDAATNHRIYTIVSQILASVNDFTEEENQ